MNIGFVDEELVNNLKEVLMYPPDYYLERDNEKIYHVIETYKFATIISRTEADVIVTHLPLILDRERGEHGFLIGHMDRNNPHCDFLKNDKPFVIFHGPNAYISPNIYESSQLPTWNSITVHVRGKTTKTESSEVVRESLIKMASILETGIKPFTLDRDDQRIQHMLKHIVGFEIEILEMIGRFKLSQNKSDKDRQFAKRHLIEESGEKHNELIDFVI